MASNLIVKVVIRPEDLNKEDFEEIKPGMCTKPSLNNIYTDVYSFIR